MAAAGSSGRAVSGAAYGIGPAALAMKPKCVGGWWAAIFAESCIMHAFCEQTHVRAQVVYSVLVACMSTSSCANPWYLSCMYIIVKLQNAVVDFVSSHGANNLDRG